ncbi:MAG: hypothetical protein J6Q07_00080 [Alistipes sp.]|nr:hypothetical protein [Alistipes sp.]
MINLFNSKYPYTDFHELNLDWLLETYQEIVDHIRILNDWMAQHKEEYAEAMARLEAVENEIATFEARVQAEFDRLAEEQAQAFAEQTAKLDRAIQEMKAEVTQEIIKLRQDVAQAIADFTAQFNQMKAQVQAEITALRILINQEIVRLNETLEVNNQYIREYVEDRLDQFINEFPTMINLVPVYNPVRGKTTSLQQAINDLYDVARVYGLTAGQYDSLGLTAKEYDDYELTAMEYDQYGYIRLGYPDENYYMLSPFTGQYAKVKDVVMDLAHFHMVGLTAQEYDDLELEAEVYDLKEITAFDYDWFGKDILTA